MPLPMPDLRTLEHPLRDEQTPSAPSFATPDLPEDVVAVLFETFRDRQGRPVNLAGLVENGLIRPLDPSVILPEYSRVIIVASGS